MRIVSFASFFALLAACGSAAPPSPLRLQRVVLYRNGVGYFEQSGRHDRQALTLRFRRRELDDVLGTLTVVEEGGRGSSLAAVLPQEARERAQTPAEDEQLIGMDVRLGAARGRRITVGYAVPTPTWMPAYRVVLHEGRGPGQALLQAWAMVHNVSGDDWSDVRLTLASGGPLSFAMDMRTPHFVARPDATGALAAPAVHAPVRSENARTADSDRDAIADVEDRCPEETEAYNGYQDEDGCPDRGMVVVTESNVQIVEHVYFTRGSSDVRAVSAPILDAIAATLRGNPHIRRIEVRGHASSDEPSSWALSAARAAAVRARLIELDVEPARLDVVPVGDAQPLDPRQTDAARDRNRRVELEIVETDGDRAAPPTGSITVASVERTGRGAAATAVASDGTRYVLTDPVSVPSGTSTLVSILQRRIGAEDVLMFRPDPAVPESDVHPFRAARLDNGTDVDLVGGPVALFANGAFVGQGLMDDLHPREQGFVPYAVDRATVVSVETNTRSAPLRMVSVVRGTMTVVDSSILRTTYTVSPGARATARIFLRHASAPGHAPVALPPGALPAGDAWLVPLPLAPGRPSVITVEERQPVRRTIALADAGGDLFAYVEPAELAPDLDRRLRDALSLRDTLGRARDAEAHVRQRLADVAERAAELRENLRATDRAGAPAAALRRQILDQLARANAETADLSAQQATLRATTLDLRTRLGDAIRDLTIDELSAAAARTPDAPAAPVVAPVARATPSYSPARVPASETPDR